MPRPVIPASAQRQVWQALSISHGALRWWLAELRDLIPETIIRAFGGSSSPLFIRIDGSTLEATAEIGRDTVPLPLGPDQALPLELSERLAEASAIILLLPESCVLRRTVELPLSAERELRAAMSFEVDRQTPFALDQVNYAYRIKERDMARKRLCVELAVVPKDTVDMARAAAAARGFAVTAARIDGDAQLPPLDLLLLSHVLRMRSLAAEPWRLICCAAALLLILGMAALSWYRHDEALGLASEVAARRAIGHRAQTLQDEIRAAETAARFLPDKRRPPPAIEILDVLSRTLPDDSWVFALDLTPKEVRIEGFAADVPEVIGLLQKAPIFETPQLRSPVIRSQSSNRDRFDLLLPLKQAAP